MAVGEDNAIRVRANWPTLLAKLFQLFIGSTGFRLVQTSGLTWAAPARTDLSEHVKSTLLLVLNVPELDENGKPPVVFVSQLDIGNSKCGSISYKVSFPAPKFWYSHISWWSDGRNVLFGIGKRQFKEDLTNKAHPPKDLRKPRRFRKVKKVK